VKRTPRLPSGRCAGKLRVLSDATRLSVIEMLLAGSKRVGEIRAELRIEQSLLSHHLKVLREAGLVKAARDGKAVRYSLAKQLEARHSGKAIDLGCCLLSFESEVEPGTADGGPKRHLRSR
jgi:DNA-binding transcriptional ArsR family regulator